MFELPKLTYNYDDLEKAIDAQTMEIHHTKHHQGYVDKLNAALENHQDLQGMPIEKLLADINSLPEDVQKAVRNNGGGHYNHNLYWSIMSPQGGSEPTGKLLEEMDHNFGSIDNFKKIFEEVAAGQFGSGWAWLIKDEQRKLQVISTPNQDNPLMSGIATMTGHPLLGVDVWEHAYYLRYQNKRADYLSSWWQVVDWSKVSGRL